MSFEYAFKTRNDISKTSDFTRVTATGCRETPSGQLVLRSARSREAPASAHEICCSRAGRDARKHSPLAVERSSSERGVDCSSRRHRQKQSSWRGRQTHPEPDNTGAI